MFVLSTKLRSCSLLKCACSEPDRGHIIQGVQGSESVGSRREVWGGMKGFPSNEGKIRKRHVGWRALVLCVLLGLTNMLPGGEGGLMQGGGWPRRLRSCRSSGPSQCNPFRLRGGGDPDDWWAEEDEQGANDKEIGVVDEGEDEGEVEGGGDEFERGGGVKEGVDWRDVGVGEKKGGDSEEAEDEESSSKGTHYSEVIIPPRSRPDKPPPVIPADIWDWDVPSGLGEEQHMTVRLSAHGTVLQLRRGSSGAMRFSACHKGTVLDVDCEGRVTEVYSASESGQGGGWGDEGERGDDWLDSWEDPGAVCRLLANEGKMLVSAGRFEVDERVDKVARVRCGHWTTELVYPGGNVCILNGMTSGLQLWLTVDGFIFFGGVEGRGAMGVWGGGACVGARRGEWRECDAAEARSALQRRVFKGMAAFKGDDVGPSPPTGGVLVKPRKKEGEVREEEEEGGGNSGGLRGGGGAEEEREEGGRGEGLRMARGRKGGVGEGGWRGGGGVRARPLGTSSHGTARGGFDAFSRLRGGRGPQKGLFDAFSRLRGGRGPQKGQGEEVEVDPDDGRTAEDQDFYTVDVPPVRTKREMEEVEKIERMTFPQLVNKLSTMFGHRPGPDHYKEMMWPGLDPLPGTHDALNLELWYAALRGHHSNVTCMIQQGAQVNSQDTTTRKWTAMHFAAVGSDEVFVGCSDTVQARTVRKLSQMGGDVNARSETGWTPLHCACTKGRVATATRLVTLGADVNAADDQGLTPLHMAARWGHKELVMRLIDLGADDEVRDKANHSALDHAWFWLEADLADDMDGTLDVLKRAGGVSGDSALLPREEMAGMLSEDEDEDEKEAVGRAEGSGAGKHVTSVKDARGKAKTGGGVGGGGGEMPVEGVLGDAMGDEEDEEVPGGVRFDEREEMEELDLEKLPVEEGDIPHWDTAAWQEKLRLFTAANGNETTPEDERVVLAHRNAAAAATQMGKGRGEKRGAGGEAGGGDGARKKAVRRKELMIGGDEDSQDEDSADRKPIVPRLASGFGNHGGDDLGDMADVIEARKAEEERAKNERDLYESMLPPEFRGGDLVKQIYRN